MPRYDIPSDEELAFIRARWTKDSLDGETLHRLCDAITELKRRINTDDRHTIPTPPPEEMEGGFPTLVGVAPPPPHVLSGALPVYRCAACLDEWSVVELPAQCPSCRSSDVFPRDSALWPCGDCGKTKEGLDPCVCLTPLERLEVLDDEEV